MTERPLAPNVRDRALSHATESARFAQRQLQVVAQLCGTGPHPAVADVSTAIADEFDQSAASLRGEAPPPDRDRLVAVLADFDDARRPVGDDLALRVGGRIGLAAGAAIAVVESTRVALGAPVDLPPAVRRKDQPFWYVGRSPLWLYLRRLEVHLTPRSVLLQNALRGALGLTAARAVAGVLDLSHGFWVLLAALTLMRTSAVDTRTTLRPAVVGTLVGSLIGGAFLVLVGDHPVVYAVLTPFVMLAAFTVGPILGLAWGQGGFALVVAFVFTQIAPSSWRLAEARLVDVVVGALTGVLAGLLAWPRGAAGEMRRAAARLLRDGTRAMRGSAAELLGAPDAGGASGVVEVGGAAGDALRLAEDAYVQYRSERPDARLDAAEVHRAMEVGRFAVRGGEFLELRYPELPSAPLSVAPDLDRLARAVVARADARAEELTGQGPPPGPLVVPDDLPSLRELAADDARRAADVEAWLLAVLTIGVSAPEAASATSGAPEPASTPGSGPGGGRPRGT